MASLVLTFRDDVRVDLLSVLPSPVAKLLQIDIHKIKAQTSQIAMSVLLLLLMKYVESGGNYTLT